MPGSAARVRFAAAAPTSPRGRDYDARRWRERLPEIEVPTLVVHGRRDRFFPVG
jgi:pimeloyl-ACP methyl ester carboxylesterase